MRRSGRRPRKSNGAWPLSHTKAENVRTINGVAERASQIILAELGPDMSRSPSDRYAASWAALCLGNDESAGKRRSGKTRKAILPTRGALIEAANAAIRTKNTYLRARYEQIKRRQRSREGDRRGRSLDPDRRLPHPQ